MNEAACYTARMQSAAGAGLRERKNDGMPVRFRIAALSGGRAGRKLTPVSAARFSVACRRRFGEGFRRSWVYAGRRGGCGSRVSVVRRRGWRLRPSGCKTVVEAELSRLHEGARSCGGLRGSDPALRGGGIGGLPFRGGMLPGVRAVFCGPVQGGKRREIRGGSSRFAEQSK